LPNLSPLSRLKIIQAVCGHHGEPINRHDYPDIRNPNKQIGAPAQEAAATIAEALIAFLQPTAMPLPEKYVELVSFWLAGLAVLADWLGSNRTWFEFRRPPQSGDLSQNIASYWETHARPGAGRALQEAGLISTSVSPRTGIAYLFDKKFTATPLSRSNPIVGITNRSIAAMSGAWLRRKVRHPWDGGPHRLTMYFATLD